MLTGTLRNYRQIFDLVPYPVCIAGLDGVIIEANSAFAEDLGFNPAAAKTNFFELINPVDAANVAAQFEQLKTGRDKVKFTCGLKNQLGIFTLVTATVQIEKESAECVLAIAPIDTSENERLLSILNETGAIAKVGGWELNIATEELIWTDEVFKMLEVEKKEGRRPHLPDGLSMYADWSRPLIRDAVERARVYGEPYSLELEAQTATGKRFWVHTNGKANYRNNKIVSLSGTIRNIHERKIAELALLRSNKDLDAARLEARKALKNTIFSLMNAMDVRDAYTADHQEKVANLSIAIGAKMKMSAQQLEGLYMGARIHDIGKITMPFYLLTKPSALSKGEYLMIQEHVSRGVAILNHISLPWPVVDIVGQHHERLDGSGYPKGLKGDQISLEAQIVAVADVYEAMTTNRPYRFAVGADVAFKELNDGAGSKYNSEAVAILADLVAEGFDFEANALALKFFE